MSDQTGIRGLLVESDIGSWVRRETYTGRAVTHAHYVQSIIEGGAITYCGLRLRQLPRRLFRIVQPFLSDPCENCPPVGDPDADLDALD